MEIRLVSPAEDLYQLCREIVATMSNCGCALSVTADDPGSDADLYIWDFQPTLSVPVRLQPDPAKHLFLVDRNDLSCFYRNTQMPDVHLLLKPVSRAMLTAFLGFTASLHSEDALRADRDQMLQCMIQTNSKLQQTDQGQINFLARAIRDFRAPLIALNGYCGLMQSGSLGPLTELQREVLRRMQNSAKRLSRATSALFQLNFGRRPEGRPQMMSQDIVRCIQQALDDVAAFASEKRITITADFWPCEERLYFEADQMEQVFLSLLDNACKFSPKHGSIEIRGYPYLWERSAAGLLPVPSNGENPDTPNSYRVDVRDSGPPVPNDHVCRIFEEHAPYTGMRDRSGGGLGLALSRMIVDQHQGRVWVQNTDSGPMFSLVLPMRLEAQAGRTPERIDRFEAADVW